MMKLHFACLRETTDQLLMLNLEEMGYEISVERTEISDEYLPTTPTHWCCDAEILPLNTTVVAMNENLLSPSLEEKISAQGLNFWNYAQLLWYLYKDRTRVVIGGHKGKTSIVKMTLHVMNYCTEKTDCIIIGEKSAQISLSKDADFVIIEANENLRSADFFQPIIGVFTNISPQQEEMAQEFIGHIRNGGILLYDQTDPTLQSVVEKSEATIRKIGYQMPTHTSKEGKLLLHTEEGILPIVFTQEYELKNTEAARWICQNMGIDQSDFLNAIVEYEP